jgi:hypothetical protein
MRALDTNTNRRSMTVKSTMNNNFYSIFADFKKEFYQCKPKLPIQTRSAPFIRNC